MHLYVKVATDGDLTATLYSVLKIQDYCDSTWAGLCSFMKVPPVACPNEPVARLKYALQMLTLAPAE